MKIVFDAEPRELTDIVAELRVLGIVKFSYAGLELVLGQPVVQVEDEALPPASEGVRLDPPRGADGLTPEEQFDRYNMVIDARR